MSHISNLAILWDIENVTPASTDNLFIEGLVEYAESLGRIVTSYAYADWARISFQRLGPMLAMRHFRLAHVPRERKGKNSADMQLVSDALELLRFYEHIDRYILVTGDSDFRPLLLSLRKSGKRIHIVCDMKTAAQDLLALADSFTDYRTLMPSGDDEDDDDEEITDKKTTQYWFERLVEASSILKQQNKTANFGPVKIKMRILNPDFHENNLKFKRFSDFVMAAMKNNYITIKRTEETNEPIIEPVLSATGNKDIDSLQQALKVLVESLQEMDKGKEPQFHSFNQIGVAINQKGIQLQKIGFSRLKRFIQSAEARGLVETKFEQVHHYVKLCAKGA